MMLQPSAPPGWLLDFGQWGVDVGIYDLMNSRWGWPIAESVHFTGLCMLMATVGMFDLRMMGLVRGLSLSALHKLVPYGVLGWCLCAASGFLFVAAAPLEYIYNDAWQIKMGLMAIAGINMAVFYRTMAKRVYALGPDAAVPLAARVIAIVSLLSWLGVITCGRVVTAFRPFWG